ncbi:MAG: glycosyltransferase family 39 protein [Chloroflexota bacterium]
MPARALRSTLCASLILLLAFAFRVVGLNDVPPGWRDDEVTETTVHAQLVLDGHYPLYFIQAEGHEPIYHYLSTGWIALVGRSLFSVRLVSAFFGLLTVAATYRLTRQLFGTRTALFVALLLAVSFWALIYSRTKIRHISELPFALLAFSHLFAAINARGLKFIIHHSSFIVLFLTLALYTYLAAATLLIIVSAFVLYLFVTHHALRITLHAPRSTLSVLIALTLALLLYLPLADAIRANAERISVVGGPLTALREGNWQPLIETSVGTLAMFGNTGDNEALYNIPGRPVFNVVGFYFFIGGVLIALSRWRDPRYAFLLIWLVGGLAPGFASNPPASLGHTITALPVTYILAALPVFHFSPQSTLKAQKANSNSANSAVNLLSAILFASIALSDLPGYFWRWPALPEVRYLYKADLHTMAKTLRGAPPATYVLTGPLSKWDRVAFTLEGVQFESAPRWVNAEWAIVFPSQPATYLFTLPDWQIDSPPDHAATVHFANDLILEGWDQRGRDVIAHWRIGPAYAATEPDMGASVASPPFPAFAFLHLFNSNGIFVAGSDRFDADAFTLQPGDRFLQRHSFDAPPGTYTLEIGLYNPTTGERYLTDDGQDAVPLGAITLP